MKKAKEGMYLLNLNEVDRVKRMHQIASNTALAEKTQISRKTWSSALNTRKPTITVLDALADLGARPDKILVLDGA